MDPKKINLEAPAFGVGSQTNEDVAEEVKASVEAEPKVEVEEKEEVPAEASVEEESKVPYSRFKKFHDRSKELERENAELKANREQEESKPVDKSDDLPASWVKLYGDSDASKEAWELQKGLNEDIKRQAREDALNALHSEREEEINRTNENVAQLDENFELLSDFMGRELTEKEQSAILDIVDEYTPKDDDGNYMGAILSFDKAWEIYELKNNAVKAPKTQARNSVAALSGSHSQGDTNVKAEKDKNFNPFNWNSYKDRI